MRFSLYPTSLLIAFVAIFVALGIAPASRQDWLLENVLVLATVATLVLTATRFRFSRAAYTCFFVFLVLHEVGAHYTYSQVPYDQWIARGQGFTLSQLLGWQRNQYDRLIHFVFGLLLVVPTLELTRLVAPARGSWRVVQATALVLAGSALYELIEWGAAVIFGGALGEAYLGTQGDAWDAQKDMACALAGALLCQVVIVAGSSLGRSPREKLVFHDGHGGDEREECAP